jgi:hypothetical protein
VSTASLARLGRTVIQLRPAQIGQRVRLRAQRLALDRQAPLASRRLLAGPDRAAGDGWPAGYLPLDAHLYLAPDGQDSAALRSGEMSLLGVLRAVAPPADDGTACWAKADWDAADAPLLWRYHLYYWDWAWMLAGTGGADDARTVFAAAWESWQQAVPWGRGTAWHPYPASLRAWSFCGVYRDLVLGSRIEDAFRGELAALAGFLRRNLETDVAATTWSRT